MGGMAWQVRRYGRVVSTQDVGKSLAVAGAPEGTVVLADEQTAARGRRGRGWFSPAAAGLWMSVVLRPFDSSIHQPLPAWSVPQVSIAAAVAAAQAVSDATGAAPVIKWPNDLLLGERKFCGILAELVADPPRPGFVILGVGMNLSIPPAAFPAELRRTATSLEAATGRPVSRERVLECFLARMAEVYALLRAGEFARIREVWLAFNNTIGRPVRISGGGADREGVAVDMDHTGALVLRRADGRLERILGGEMTLRFVL